MINSAQKGQFYEIDVLYTGCELSTYYIRWDFLNSYIFSKQLKEQAFQFQTREDARVSVSAELEQHIVYFWLNEIFNVACGIKYLSIE